MKKKKKKSFKIVAPFFLTKLKCSYWIWWITYLSLSWHFVYPSWTYLAAILGVQWRSIDITRHFVDCIQNVTVLVNCLAFLPQTLFIPNHPHPWTPPPTPPPLCLVTLLFVSSLFPHGPKLIFDLKATRCLFYVHTFKLIVKSNN